MGADNFYDWRQRITFTPLPFFGSEDVRQKATATAWMWINGFVDWEDVYKEGATDIRELYVRAEQPDIAPRDLAEPLCTAFNFMAIHCAFSFCHDNHCESPLGRRTALKETLRKFAVTAGSAPPIPKTLGIFNFVQSSANRELNHLRHTIEHNPEATAADSIRMFDTFSKQHLTSDWKGPFLPDYIWYYRLSASYMALRAIACHWAGTRDTTLAERQDMLVTHSPTSTHCGRAALTLSQVWWPRNFPPRFRSRSSFQSSTNILPQSKQSRLTQLPLLPSHTRLPLSKNKGESPPPQTN